MTVRGATSRALETVTRRVNREVEWDAHSADIIIGKDVLELLSTSMYVDPMAVYREYVQNAADAIDEARRQGLLQPGQGEIKINIDVVSRSIRVRDDGVGIRANIFARQLTALGRSSKRGTSARGFRGVGRLAGLGYGQELIFRSRVAGEATVSELRWDCRHLIATLRNTEFVGGLAEIIQAVVSVRKISADGYPERFFEVELRGIIRHKTDRLLSPPAVAEYLSQVGPVPFSPEFKFGADILAALTANGAHSDVAINVSGIEGQLFRPHANFFEVSDGVSDEFTELELIAVPGVDAGVAAVAWVLHHGYTGAIPASASIKGVRLRSGNIQVGDNSLLEELFPEARFNSWCVGEVHMFDSRVIPNGRRDHFQSNVHFNSIMNHLAPLARDIARRCRSSSIRRNWLRQFELQCVTVKEKAEILQQGVLGSRERSQVEREARVALDHMARIAEREALDLDGRLKSAVRSEERRLYKALGSAQSALSLDRLPVAKRKMYEHLFSLVYECSTNRAAAKALIDRILLKIG